MLPVVFEKSEMGLRFFATFFYSLSLSIGKRSTLANIWGGDVAPSFSVFTGENLIQLEKVNQSHIMYGTPKLFLI